MRCDADAALANLPDETDSEKGYLYAFSLANGTTRVGFSLNPKSKLKAALSDARRRPELAVSECLVSISHHECWKTEFMIHNRFSAQRQFGDVFALTLEQIAEALQEMQLRPA